MSGSDVKIADRKLFIIGMLVFHEKEAEKECFMTRNLSRAFEKVDVSDESEPSWLEPELELKDIQLGS